MNDKDFHSKPLEELAGIYQTDLERGLTRQEAQARL